jgi:hypothetical protein
MVACKLKGTFCRFYLLQKDKNFFYNFHEYTKAFGLWIYFYFYGAWAPPLLFGENPDK